MHGYHTQTWSQGRLTRLRHESRVLAGNPWQDPVHRDLTVYLPPGYEDSDESYPALWHLAAYTNSGASMGNWRNFGENMQARLDRLIGTGEMGPVIVLAPDCFTSLGGNQYVNSPAVGRYEDYIHDELIEFSESALRIRPGRRHRAVFGKSSGGYGALGFAMRRPDCWSAVANHSGDAQFDVIFRRDFPTAASTLRNCQGSVEQFLEAFWAKDAVSGKEVHTLMLLCMAASYDPNPAQPTDIQLPFDLHTLELDDQRWQRWLAHDPVHCVPGAAEALKSMRGVYMDCGWRDQYFIQYGCRILARMMKELGVEFHYEEFDGTHSGIDHRLNLSLPYLYRILSQEV